MDPSESFDEQLCILSLDNISAFDVVQGDLKEVILWKSLPRGYLKRHSFVAICNRWQKSKPLPEIKPTLSRLDRPYLHREGIIGMAEVLSCVQTYPKSNSYKYTFGQVHLIYPMMFYTQKTAVVVAPLDIRDQFLEHIGYEVW